MKTIATLAIAFLCVIAAAQTTPTPQLSTADKIAIQIQEQRKTDAQKMFTDAQQTEALIAKEWTTAHPGYVLNPQTFVVEAVPVAPKK